MKPRCSWRALAALATSVFVTAGLANADTYSQNFDAFVDGTTVLGMALVCCSIPVQIE